MSDNNTPSPIPFKPPLSFVKASEERQNKLKQKKHETSTSVSTSTPCPIKSPKSPTKSTIKNQTPMKVQASSVSKTTKEIELINKTRQDRRAKLAQYKQIKENMSQGEQDLIGYKYLIKKFKGQYKVTTSKRDNVEPLWADETKAIRVCVRKRPVSESNLLDVITITESSPGKSDQLYLHVTGNSVDLTPSVDTHLFQFDRVFDESCNNSQIYAESIEPMVHVFLNNPGAKPTFIAYGQTGSGKSHTVFGNNNDFGIVTLAGQRLIQHLQERKDVKLQLSFFEIYGNRIIDLLNQGQVLSMLENSSSMNLPGLKRVDIASDKDFMTFVKLGQQKRRTSPTDANAQSSRSHAIIQIILICQAKSNADPSVFTVVDLAGSEKTSEANAPDRHSILESGDINKSLLSLKECIRALGDPSAKHVPFRGSKLTMILRDCLGGETRKAGQKDNIKKLVLMMATVRCTNDAAEHSLNTLRYAYRLRESTNVSPETLVDRRTYDKMEMMEDFARSMVKENEVLKEGEVTSPKHEKQNLAKAEIVDIVQNDKNLITDLKSPKSKVATAAKIQIKTSPVVIKEDASVSSAQKFKLLRNPPVTVIHSDLPVPKLDHDELRTKENEEDPFEDLIWKHMNSLQLFVTEGEEEKGWLSNEKITTNDIQEYVSRLQSAILKKHNSLETLLDAVNRVKREYNLK